MLNLVYAGTNDEKVDQVLSRRMKDRYDLFGSPPDTIQDGWIDDIGNLKHISPSSRKRNAGRTLLIYLTVKRSRQRAPGGICAKRSSLGATWWNDYRKAGSPLSEKSEKRRILGEVPGKLL